MKSNICFSGHIDLWNLFSPIVWNVEYKRNPNYGSAQCFHCLLSPEGDDPIFIGINRLVDKGLVEENKDGNPSPEFPCPVVNRFECPYEKGNSPSAKFDVDDLFALANMTFAVEISLAVAKRDTSVIQIKNKQDLNHVLTNREMFDMVLEQGLDYVLSVLSDKKTFNDTAKFEQLQKNNRDKIVDYFMNIKDKAKFKELRFY